MRNHAVSLEPNRRDDELLELREATLRLAATMTEPTLRLRLLKIAQELLDLRSLGRTSETLPGAPVG
jgi:hypothetical protein